MGYTKAAILGFSWHGLFKASAAAITVLKLFVLARLLGPQDFGLFSLVAIVLGITEALTETGINITIIQSKQSVSYFLNSAWVVAIIRGLLIGIIMMAASMALGNYYHEPLLPFLISLAALVPVIKGFINPSIVVLQKNLRFFHDSVYRFSLVFIEATLSILLALYMGSVTALVLALVGASILEVLISFMFFKERPRFVPVMSRVREILHNAKGLTVSAGFSYLFQNADDAIVGKTLGTTMLGFYHNAYALGHKLTYEVAQASHHGTLPVYSKIINELPRLKHAFIRSVAITMGLAFVLSTPLFVMPQFVVQILLGEAWLPIVPAVPLMAAAGILSSLSLACYSVFIARRQYGIMNTHLGLTTALMMGLLLMSGSSGGLEGAAWALVVSRVLPIPLLFIGLQPLLKQHE